MDLVSIPKAELHCHLDGSLSLTTLRQLLDRPELSLADVQAPNRCRDLAEYLQKFDLPLSGLQTRSQLEQAAHDLLLDMARENVTYAEIRFAPMLHINAGLCCEEVIESVLCGLQSAQKENKAIEGQLIICAMRHHSPEQNQKALDAALAFRGRGVCALDLAGDEAAFPMVLFKDLFRAAHREALPFTIHAGECGSPSNIREAVSLGARRIGHGIALYKDPSLLHELAERGIGIEMCPTSNLQTRAVTDWTQYPLPVFLEAGIPVSVHTDNRTVSGTTLTHELQLVYDTWQDEGMVRRLIQNAFETAFRS